MSFDWSFIVVNIPAAVPREVHSNFIIGVRAATKLLERKNTEIRVDKRKTREFEIQDPRAFIVYKHQIWLKSDDDDGDGTYKKDI